jgi:hypothetical protein
VFRVYARAMGQQRFGGVRSAAYAESSIRRMSWAALLAVEEWFHRAGLSDPEIDQWLDHLWRWSVVTQKAFDDWYRTRPELVSIEQTGLLPERLNGVAKSASNPADEFRSVIFAATDVIYASLFGGINWEYRAESLDAIVDVLDRYELGLPPPNCLPRSSRSEWHGWGNAVDEKTMAAIRTLDWTTGC